MLWLLLLACAPIDGVSWSITGPLGSDVGVAHVGDDCDGDVCSDYRQGEGSNAGRLQLLERTPSGYSGVTGWPLTGEWVAEQGTDLQAVAEPVVCVDDLYELDTADDCRLTWASSCVGATLTVELRGDVQLPGACAD